MKVHGASNPQAWQLFKAKQGEIPAQTDKQVTSADKSASKTEPPSVPADSEQPESKGVVRLLEQGHFRGVADVRLRINFHQELQQKTDQAGGAISEAGSALLTQLSDRVTDLGSSFDFADQTAGMLQDFSDALTPLLSQAAAERAEPPGMAEAVQEALADLRQSLQEAYMPASMAPLAEANTPTGQEAGGAGPEATVAATAAEGAAAETTSTPDPFDVALDDLEAWFNDQLSTFHSLVAGSFSLPPLSAPQGQGVAYSRFVEAYNSLQGSPPDQPETGPSPTAAVETKA